MLSAIAVFLFISTTFARQLHSFSTEIEHFIFLSIFVLYFKDFEIEIDFENLRYFLSRRICQKTFLAKIDKNELCNIPAVLLSVINLFTEYEVYLFLTVSTWTGVSL